MWSLQPLVAHNVGSTPWSVATPTTSRTPSLVRNKCMIYIQILLGYVIYYNAMSIYINRIQCFMFHSYSSQMILYEYILFGLANLLVLYVLHIGWITDKFLWCVFVCFFVCMLRRSANWRRNTIFRMNLI